MYEIMPVLCVVFPWILLVRAERVNHTIAVSGERRVPMGVTINPQLSKLSQNAQWRGESDQVTAQHSLNAPVINTCLARRSSLLSSYPKLCLIDSPCSYRLALDFVEIWPPFQRESADTESEPTTGESAVGSLCLCASGAADTQVLVV